MIVLNEKAKPKEPVIDLNLGMWGCSWVNVLVSSSKITTNEKMLVMRDAQKVWNNASAKRREFMLKAKTCDCFPWNTSEEGSDFWAHIFARQWL
jgi:hypothetical protein